MDCLWLRKVIMKCKDLNYYIKTKQKMVLRGTIRFKLDKYANTKGVLPKNKGSELFTPSLLIGAYVVCKVKNVKPNQ